VKERGIELIKVLPDDRTLEDILYHLYVREKVEAGLGAVGEGRTTPKAGVEERTRQWLKSSGRSQQQTICDLLLSMLPETPPRKQTPPFVCFSLRVSALKKEESETQRRQDAEEIFMVSG
jgi:hypothetical protein